MPKNWAKIVKKITKVEANNESGSKINEIPISIKSKVKRNLPRSIKYTDEEDMRLIKVQIENTNEVSRVINDAI